MTGPMARLLVAMTVLMTTAAACSNESDGGDPGRAAAAAADAPPKTTDARSLPLTEQWAWKPPDGVSVGMPAADAAGVAFGTSRARVVLLDAAGAVRWEAEQNDLRTVPPALTPDLVVAATQGGLVAFERATGRRSWAATMGDRTNAPVVAGGRAVVTTWEGTFAAVDLADGKVAWRMQLDGAVLGPPAASGMTALATFDSGRVAGLVAVDVASGRKRWTAPLDPDGVSAPAVTTGGVVALVAGDVAGHGFGLDDGAERWRLKLHGSGSPEVPPLALGDGSVLLAHRLGGLAMVDGRDGTLRWGIMPQGAAVRGGPAGPGPNGWFAMPLVDGSLMLATGQGRDAEVRELDSAVSGVAVGPGGLLVYATGKGRQNQLTASSGW